MKCNVGVLDRIIRAIVGLILVTLPIALQMGGALKIVLFVIGAIFLFTAASGFCLLYLPFGINTCKR